jgi:hypothetical protein
VCQSVRWAPSPRLLHIRLMQSSPRLRYASVEHVLERAYSPIEIAIALSRSGFVCRGVHCPNSMRRASRCLPRLVVVAQRVPSQPVYRT